MITHHSCKREPHLTRTAAAEPQHHFTISCMYMASVLIGYFDVRIRQNAGTDKRDVLWNEPIGDDLKLTSSASWTLTLPQAWL
jgi:hypothetical protein